MNLAIGTALIVLGLIVTLLTYKNIRIKKKMGLVWGGFNLISLSFILLVFGIYVIVK